VSGRKPLQDESSPEEQPADASGVDHGELGLDPARERLDARELPQLLRQLMDLIPGPVFVFCRGGNVVYLNQFARRIAACGKKERKPLSVLDCIAPEDRERAAAAMESASLGVPEETVLRFLSAPGGIEQYLCSISVVNGRDEPLLVSIGLGVPELARAREGLSFELMGTALASRLISTTTDEIPDGMRDTLSAVCEFTGVDRGLILSFPADISVTSVIAEWGRGELRPVADRFENLSSAIAVPWVVSLLRRGERYFDDSASTEPPGPFLADIRRRAGVTALIQVPLCCGERLLGVLLLGAVDRQVETAWTDDTAGLVQLCSEMFANALDRIEKDRALRTRTDEIHAVLDGTEDGLLVADAQGRVVLTSRMFNEIWGFAEIPQRGMRVFDVARDIRACLKDPSQFDLRSGASVPRHRHTVKLGLEDGRIIEWSRYALLLPESNMGVAWSFRDVTDREELETRFRQAQKLEAVGQLAGGIAHDFNNVLFTITSACELALLTGAEGQTADSLKHILASAQRAAALTRQLLAFSRKQILNLTPLDLNQVIVEIHSLLTRILGGHCELRLELGEHLGHTCGDKSQLEQLLLNLVVNARDAVTEGGVITVRTREVSLSSSDCRPLSELTPGRYVALTVSDDGVGMTDAVVARIFEPFFTTKAAGNVGLGLATVFGIVKQHNGAIKVESKLDAGTKFHILLPRHDERSELTCPANQTTPFGNGETILLVEDEELARRMTADALSQLGYSVITACDGEEALRIEQGASRTVDLLLTDFVVPHVNGVELAQRLKKKIPGLAVVFISGHAPDIIFGSQDGAAPQPFVQKPFRLQELARTVRRVLDARTRDLSEDVASGSNTR